VCEEKEKLIVPKKTRVCFQNCQSSLIKPQKPALLSSALDIFRLNFLPKGGCTFFLVLLFCSAALLLFSADLSTRTRDRKKTKK